MQKSFIGLYAALLSVAIFLPSCNSSKELSTQEAVLRLNLNKGDVYASVMNMDMDMKGMGDMKMKMDIKSSYEASDVSNGDIITLNTTIDKIGMEMNSAMANMKYDSENPTTDDPMQVEMHKTMKDLIGVVMPAKINNMGKVVEAPNMDEIFKDSALKDQASSMNQGFEQAFIPFPKEAVKVGTTWNNEIVVQGQMPMSSNITYTVKEITPSQVTLNMTSVLKTLDSSATGKGGGTMTGELTLDRATGMVLQSDAVQDMKLSVMGMDMDMKSIIKMTNTKVK